MTTLADKPAWLSAWHAEHPERVEEGAKRAARDAAQREAQRAARAASTPKREATPKPRTAPAQRAQAAKAKPAGDRVWSQPLGHDLEEPEPWAWDGGKRREQVLDHNFSPPRVVRQVGWRCCITCARSFFSQDVIKVRMCDRCRPEQPPW